MWFRLQTISVEVGCEGGEMGGASVWAYDTSYLNKMMTVVVVVVVAAAAVMMELTIMMTIPCLFPHHCSLKQCFQPAQ